MKDEQRNLVLILVRQLATHLTTPLFCVDPGGWLIYYNEPAERVLGRRFADAGPLSPDDWGSIFRPETLDGEPLSLASLPLAIAIRDLRPDHDVFRITGLDGVKRVISVTALPLFVRGDSFVGAVAVFWEPAEIG